MDMYKNELSELTHSIKEYGGVKKLTENIKNQSYQLGVSYATKKYKPMVVVGICTGLVAGISIGKTVEYLKRKKIQKDAKEQIKDVENALIEELNALREETHSLLKEVEEKTNELK